MSFWKYIPTFAKWFGKTIDVTDSDEDLMVRSAGVGGSVASSEIIEDIKQAHDQRYIWEKHTDHLGGEHFFFYAGALEVDAEKVMNNRIPIVEQMLIDNEITETVSKVENGESYKLDFATDEQLKIALIERETEQEVEITELTEKKNNVSDEIDNIPTSVVP